MDISKLLAYFCDVLCGIHLASCTLLCIESGNLVLNSFSKLVLLFSHFSVSMESGLHLGYIPDSNIEILLLQKR